MDMREQAKEVIMPGASGAGGYGHIFGETSSEVVERRIESIHNDSHHLEADRFAGENNGGGGGGRSKGLAAVTGVRYWECLKNHAASVGGNIYDGCGEFMPCGEAGTLEALKCAACECHRNFHRKQIDGETQLSRIGANYNYNRRGGVMLPHLQVPPPLPSPSALHGHPKFCMALNLHSSPSAPIIAPMSVAYGGGGGNESSSEDLNGVRPPCSYSLSKKRNRTKFTQGQKDRMLEFAEKMGWRIQKQDEGEVERFCSEVGVKRQVLKVWMHNNKNTTKKQEDNHELPELVAVKTES